LRWNEHIKRDGETIFRHACMLGVEGIVSMRKVSPYRSGRSPDWLKIKDAEPTVWDRTQEVNASDSIPADFRHACKLGLEGIVSKRKDSPYRSGRSPDWLKMKNPAAPAVKREAEEDWVR
jgi:ATP-dependent DNA ligase